MTNHKFEQPAGNGAGHERSLGEVAAEIKQELQDFIKTRVELLRSELQGKARQLKMALPLLAVGALLAAVALVVLTFALVAAISLAFEGMRSPWALAALIVGGAYLLLGGLAAFVGWRELRTLGRTPERTARVLREDQAWLRREASRTRSQS